MDPIKTKTPAYVPYKSFKGYIGGLADKNDGHLPSHIDKSLFSTMSGATLNQFMNSLRFLELLTADGQPTEKFKVLASAASTASPDPEKWKKTMGELIKQAYPEQITILASGTIGKLKESFGEELKATAIVIPAMRFLIAAAQDSGIKVISHIANGVPAAPKKAAKPRPKQPPEPVVHEEEVVATPVARPSTVDSFRSAMLEKFPPFNPAWDDAQQKSWFSAYEKLLAISPAQH